MRPALLSFGLAPPLSKIFFEQRPFRLVKRHKDIHGSYLDILIAFLNFKISNNHSTRIWCKSYLFTSLEI